jgi:hypothetical protein
VVVRVAAAVVLAGCSCATAAVTPDSGSVDVPTDTGPPPEAWVPAFEPRLVWEDPSVSCTPIPYEYAATREPAEAGAVRWVYHPGADPEFRERASELFVSSVQFTLHRLTLSGHGGLIARINEDFLLYLGAAHEFLRLARTRREDPDPMWVPPDRILGGSGPLIGVSGPPGSGHTIPLWDYSGREVDAYPVPLPGTDRTDPKIRANRPALLVDGSVVWTPTPSSIVIACVEDGRLRAVIEHDPAPSPIAGVPVLYAPRSGGFVFFYGEAYRFDAGGHLVAHASPRDRRGIQALGLSDRCGLAMARHDRLEWWDFETMTPRASVVTDALDPLYARPTPDCGLVAWHRLSGRKIRRLGETGAWHYEVPDPGSEDAVVRDLWPLDDGGVLLFYDGPLQLLNLGPDGAIRQHVFLDPAVVGQSVFVPNFALTPDGVLYFVGDTGLGLSQAIVAVETGVRPAYPMFGLWGQSGLDWALTSATWTTPEE